MEPIDFNQSTTLPLLTLGSNNTEFDYAAYLQDEDLDYLGDTGSSGSASVMNDVTSGAVSPPTSSAVVRSNSNQKPRLERRGHTKSRRGCYNCKRRRIKVFLPCCGSSVTLLTSVPTVSRNSTVVRALHQDRSQVRIPGRASGDSPGKSRMLRSDFLNADIMLSRNIKFLSLVFKICVSSSIFSSPVLHITRWETSRSGHSKCHACLRM